MFLEQLQLQNVLSYRAITFDFQPVTAIIGANGSGKSNFLRAIELLQGAAGDLSRFSWGGGGHRAWFYGFGQESHLTLTARFPARVEYTLTLATDTGNLEVLSERGVQPAGPSTKRFKRTGSEVAISGRPGMEIGPLNSQETALSRIEFSSLGPLAATVTFLKKIRFYSAFDLRTGSPLRVGVLASSEKDFLSASGDNLALVLNRMEHKGKIEPILRYMRRVLPTLKRFSILIEGSYAALYFHLTEHEEGVPAGRLSDGTLNFLCLLTVLFDPEPAPMICLEEPEKGLHPEAVTLLGKAILEASERKQIVLTTHSKDLVDAFSARPEYVVTAEYQPGQGTLLNRHTREELDIWLDDYSLGELWVRGEIGGNLQ